MDNTSNTYDLYYDIRERTKGEIYIGVLGPVRTGKSTFIKRFMEELVLPNMEDDNARNRARDEMPQSAGGKTITTTEPKFVPSEAANVHLNSDVAVSVRLVDCVGYMVEGAAGHMEEEAERMVKTPWSEQAIPFSRAAEIGTDKVMNDHSTIGLVVTCDGSFGEIPRVNYLQAEEKTITALKKLNKPFLVLLNSARPYAEETRQLAQDIAKKYSVHVLPVNCEQLKKEDINRVLEKVLYEFPLTSISFYEPEWFAMLPQDNELKADLINQVREYIPGLSTVGEYLENPIRLNGPYIGECRTDKINLSDGSVRIILSVKEEYYYSMLTNMVNEEIPDEHSLMEVLQKYVDLKQNYIKILEAVNAVKGNGYGVVIPEKDEILLEKPELIKHGSKFGVKIKANCPSIHMIRANIETEIAPIVGSEQQANDLINYISQSEEKSGIWNTTIFGKTVEQMVCDGMRTKVAMIGEESQVKLQDTMQKVVNDTNGGMVCIIL